VKGKEEELFGKIQKKLGLTREALNLIMQKHLCKQEKDKPKG
jgi:hypothetical protein